MYIEKKTFQNTLLKADKTDYFILSKDLECDWGVFKAGTRVRISLKSFGRYSAEYKVISKECSDSLTLYESDFSTTELQNFFERTFIPDKKATEKAKKMIKQYDDSKIKLIDKIGTIFFAVGFISLICLIAIWLFPPFFVIDEKETAFILAFLFTIFCFLICYILSKTESAIDAKRQKAVKINLDAILKGDAENE